VETRRLLIAAALSLAVLFAWQYLFPAPKPPVPSSAPSASPSLAASAPASPAAAAAPSPGATPGTSPGAPAAETPVEGSAEQTTVLETKSFRAEFSNRGAELVSFILKDYRGIGGQPLDLVRKRRDWAHPFALVQANGEELPIGGALFAVEPMEGGRGVRYRYSGPLGRATKEFRLREDGLFDVRIEVPGAKEWGVLLGPGVGNPSVAEASSRFAQRAVIYKIGDDVSTIDAPANKDGTRFSASGLAWAGVEDTYFLTALLPKDAPKDLAVVPVLVEKGSEGPSFEIAPPKDKLTGAQKDLPRELELVLVPGGEVFEGQAFFGPKQYDLLAQFGLEKTVRWGRWGLLARPLLLALHWIYDHVVGNYGWAIVLMTVAIKLVLLPLTHKSFVSMQKMQAVNPRIQAIREKWRPRLKDKKGRPDFEAQRKMQEEMNALFKAEGVNPAGGCLPMLLQLPVLFAFYNVLSTAIELRGAPWLFWVHDLSKADPYYVLPIVMGVSQLVQQRLAPQATDPLQRRLFQLMPIVFTVLFLGFPSGLVLYWLVNNVLTILQQWVYNRNRQPVASRA